VPSRVLREKSGEASTLTLPPPLLSSWTGASFTGSGCSRGSRGRDPCSGRLRRPLVTPTADLRACSTREGTSSTQTRGGADARRRFRLIQCVFVCFVCCAAWVECLESRATSGRWRGVVRCGCCGCGVPSATPPPYTCMYLLPLLSRAARVSFIIRTFTPTLVLG